ncbi:Uncharacterised protein [Enterobacter hormaechei]|uniref:hypothetical protein n=1 Tax=Enterobacter hormaechei TaxID=158836 RepID=UPI00079C636C|nr:hypothetical protein [Enterobacter hormaechei]SAE41884.1 Uncharacterised protein [Enterobacter hormaechei]
MIIDNEFNTRYLDLFCQSPVSRIILMTSDDEALKLNRIEINFTEYDALSDKIRLLCINYGNIANHYVWDGKNQIQTQFTIADCLESAETDLKSIVGKKFDSFARRAINAAWSEVRVDFLLKHRVETPSVAVPCKSTLAELGIDLTDDLAALMFLSTSDNYFVGNSLLQQISLSVKNSDVERLSLVCTDIAYGNYAKKLRDIARCINRKLKGVYYIDTVLDALRYIEFCQGWESKYIKEHFSELENNGVRFINFNLSNDEVHDYYKELFMKESDFLKTQDLNHQAEFIGQLWDVWFEELCDEAKRYDRQHGRFN